MSKLPAIRSVDYVRQLTLISMEGGIMAPTVFPKYLRIDLS